MKMDELMKLFSMNITVQISQVANFYLFCKFNTLSGRSYESAKMSRSGVSVKQ